MSKVARRAVLTGGIAAIAAPVCPSLADTKPTDPLIVMCEESDRLWAEYLRYDKMYDDQLLSAGEFEVATDPIFDRMHELADVIVKTKATTLEGLSAQYRVYMRTCGDAIKDMYCKEWAAGIGTIQAGFDALIR